MFLSGRMACLATRKITTISSLNDVEFRVTSQMGEDGIIDWLIERLAIPTHAFVEFGVENYKEANTRFLLQNRDWRGLVLDGDETNVEHIRNDEISWRHDLTAMCAFVNRDNIDTLLRLCGFSGEVGLLSIDIDGNDYWIWERIMEINPIICVCEYNAVFGDVAPISIPYDSQFFRTRAHHSNLYYGASIAALRFLADRKGYKCVGTTLSGGNAFFVRDDYAHLVTDLIRVMSPHPSHSRESRNEQGDLTFMSGPRRLDVIAHLPVVNVETGKILELRTVDPIYSPEWIREMTSGSPEAGA